MVLDFEEMRRIYRLEKSTARLVEVPMDFFYQLHGLIDEERKKYFDSLKDLNTTRARDFGNLKKLVDEWFVVREKKLLNTVLMSARLEEMDSQHMSAEEKIMVDNVYAALMLHRSTTKKVMDANGEFVAIHTTPIETPMVSEIKVEEKITQTIPPVQHARSTSEDSLSIRILSEVPSFVGTDLKEYGPYKPGQVVELPEKIAQLFVSRKLGENTS